ncbi:TRAP transporter substrate-binding protein [Nocardioides insulae]|uniref:TRAP transporter substrate-binding protein n=1 Tax=Nocardioides insulae TaxID=394734 RepID=UPI0006891C7E|nr:TRAP transporter substrate-binding protein DctP [Nocardioides insulae]
MNSNDPRTDWRRKLVAPAALSIAALALTACAGSAGGGDTGSGDNAGGGEGFAYGASQDEVDAAVEDLEPVTLTFQPTAASQNTIAAPAGIAFKKLVEERSNGKITLDLVWGQAIADYAEIHDALVDGRVDIADTLPVYQPTEFPAVNDLGTVMAGLPSSPYIGEMVANAVGNEAGWNNDTVLTEYEEMGLTPLTPFKALGGYYYLCDEPVQSAEDLKGRQVRIASAAQAEQVKELGSTPVSMEYGEVFEALQRGAVDCTLAPLLTSAESGLLEVAPHIGYTTDYSFSRSPGAFLAGSSFKELPLAYQQILFDANMTAQATNILGVIKGNAMAIQQAKEAGGEIHELDEDVQQTLGKHAEELAEETLANENLNDDAGEAIAASMDAWLEKFASRGYQDGGSTEDTDVWFDIDTDSTEFDEYATALYEDGAAMDHRPE